MEPFLPPLTIQEETGCFEKVRQGSKEARELLILHNMRLVAHVVKRYMGAKEEPEELIQIGAIGLMKAVDTYAAEKGNRFSTYAIRCIQNEILMCFRSRKRQNSEVSIFEPIGMDKEGNAILLFDVLEGDERDVVQDMETACMLAKLKRGMQQILTPREYQIIVQRYGLFEHPETTQRELAAQLNISRSYISRIEKRALAKLKNFLQKPDEK